MSKTFFTVLVLSLIVFITKATNIPIPVQKAFEQKFPNATGLKWDKENAHEYEASFVWKGEKYSANFSDSGEWLETESPISFSLLPVKVQSAFSASHKKETVRNTSKIETNKNTMKYEIEFRQGVKNSEILYDSEGKELKN